MFDKYVICFIVFSSIIVSSWATITPVCKWYGIAPFCLLGNSCPDQCWKVASNDRGDGATCWFGEKNYCCCVKQAVDSIINTIINPK